MSVGPGHVTTYGDLARAAGMPNAQRYIGNILNRNPYPGLVPCHRVIRSDGTVGGYAYGQAVKSRMLSDEGIRLEGCRIMHMDMVRHRFLPGRHEPRP